MECNDLYASKSVHFYNPTGEINYKLSFEPESADTVIVFNSKNIAQSGCNFTCGSGKVIVFSIGD